MVKTWFLLGAVLLTSGQQSQWPTLRTQLVAHQVPVDGVDDLDQQVTNSTVDDNADWFAIAYYWYNASNSNWLPRELRIRTYDRKNARWTSAVLDGESLHVGPVLHIRRQGRWVYVDTDLSPSAGALLVLGDDLRVRRRLYGWTQEILPDGRVVYQNSMVHFAPAHPGSLSLYDPRTDRDVPLYPSVAVPEGSPRWMKDRSFDAIRRLDSRRLAFTVIEQDITLQRDNTGVPQGPQRSFHVTCDIAAARPRCIASARRKPGPPIAAADPGQMCDYLLRTAGVVPGPAGARRWSRVRTALAFRVAGAADGESSD